MREEVAWRKNRAGLLVPMYEIAGGGLTSIPRHVDLSDVPAGVNPDTHHPRDTGGGFSAHGGTHAAGGTDPVAQQTIFYADLGTTVDQVLNNTAALADSNELQIVLPAGSWWLEGRIVYQASATADFKSNLQGGGFIGNGTAVAAIGLDTTAASAIGPAVFSGMSINSAAGVVHGGVGVATSSRMMFSGRLQTNGSNTWRFQFAQGTAEVSNVTLKAASRILIYKLP